MTTLLFDYDPLLYAAGSVGEKRTIQVVHNKSGDEYEFKTRTDFWGHWKTKSGGWLAEYNKGKNSQRSANEFTITDVQTPEPIENCLHTIKSMIKGIVEAVGADSYYGYSGRGKVFREDISTILQYKGTRASSLRPLHLEALKEYLVDHQACEVVETIEADDACSIDSYSAYNKWVKSKCDKDKLVLALQDKDYYQCAGHLYNTNTCASICSYDGFGWLNTNEKGDVKGRGRMWLYQQVLSNDVSDNYAANSASDLKWGEKAAYKLLKGCSNDKQAFEALVAGYKTLYPAKKKIVGWRGDSIEIDYLYVLQENFNLAKMLRTRDEKTTNIRELLTKLQIEHE